MSRTSRLLVLATIAVLASACGACGSSASAPPIGSELPGCDGATLLASSADRAARGVWAVGARTVSVGALTAEVWYPAPPGAAEGRDPERYDIRASLPPTEAAKIPDADNPWQDCDCVRDLPLDEAHGPYPVVVFVHGTAAFRHQSLAIVTHWASRGFVVIAADHPGLMLRDLIAMACGEPATPQNLSGDLDVVLAALADPRDGLGFLAGRIDATRIAVAGHSAGGSAAAAATGKPGVQAVISMAGARRAEASATLRSSLFLAGTADTIVSVGQVRTAWSGSATPRRFVAIEQAGHLAFSDLCAARNAEGQDLLAVAEEHAVCGAQLAGFLFDCDPGYLAARAGWDIINHATTAVLEPTLQCQPAVDLGTLATTYPQVSEYAEQL